MLQPIAPRQAGHSLALAEGEDPRNQVPGGHAGERVLVDLTEELRGDPQESDRTNLATAGSLDQGLELSEDPPTQCLYVQNKGQSLVLLRPSKVPPGLCRRCNLR